MVKNSSFTTIWGDRFKPKSTVYFDMADDDSSSDEEQPNEPEPSLDGQPIFNSGDPDEDESSDSE